MAEHVAILHQQYVRLILAGRKTVESRLTVRPLAPFSKVEPGERIYFKVTSGPYQATAIADQIDQRDNLTPAIIEQLYRRYNDAVCGEEAYWQMKRNAKFATFITLRDVQPCTRGPALPKSQGLAWFVVPSVPTPASAAIIEAPLTDGGIRNGYVRLRDGSALAGECDGITLVLPDGSEVGTDIRDDRMIRWRGWRPWFAAAGARAGDLVAFTALGRHRYAVAIMRPTVASHSAEVSRR
jgi:hypothetical protein